MHPVDLGLLFNLSQAHLCHHQTRTAIARDPSVSGLVKRSGSRAEHSRHRSRSTTSWLDDLRQVKFFGPQYLGSETRIIMVPK